MGSKKVLYFEKRFKVIYYDVDESTILYIQYVPDNSLITAPTGLPHELVTGGWYIRDSSGELTTEWNFTTDRVNADINLYTKDAYFRIQFYTDGSGYNIPAQGSVTPVVNKSGATLSYTLDYGVTWTNWSSGAISSSGTDPIYFKANGKGLFSSANTNNHWTLSTWCNVGGHTETLRQGGSADSAGSFAYMFYNQSYLLSARRVRTIGSFQGHDLEGMFEGCSSLKYPPEIPAAYYHDSTCKSMFKGCAELIRFPTLNVNNLENISCSEMFYGCKKARENPPLKLLPVTFKRQCYEYMFYGCESLVNGPELMLQNASEFCSQHMFEGCKSLKSLKIHFTGWSTTATDNWLKNVSVSGELICPAALPDERGVSRIPTGWTKTDL